MATIVTREVGATAKSSPLSNAELDANLNNLNTDIANNDSTLTAINTKLNTLSIDSLLASNAKPLYRGNRFFNGIYIYDTSKDSDGGAWTEKCQHTSWYNETLSGNWLGRFASEADARHHNANYGSEIFSNFSSSSNWNQIVGVESISNSLVFDAESDRITKYTGISQNLNYELKITLTTTSSATLKIDNDSGSGGGISQEYAGPLTTGTYTIRFTANGTSTRIRLIQNSFGTITVTAFSLKQVISTTTQSNDYFQLTTNGMFYKLNPGSGITQVYRGNKRNFPKLAALVYEQGTALGNSDSSLIIYDLTEPDFPMWKEYVFNSGSYWWGNPNQTLTDSYGQIFGKEGNIVIPKESGYILNLIKDTPILFPEQNTTRTLIGASAITLKNSPLDVVTNLKQITFGISSFNATNRYVNTNNRNFVAYSGTLQNAAISLVTPNLFVTANDSAILNFFKAPLFNSANYNTSILSPPYNAMAATKALYANNSDFVITYPTATTRRFQRLKINHNAIQTKSLVAEIGNTYNTGYICGDIRRILLAENTIGVSGSIADRSYKNKPANVLGVVPKTAVNTNSELVAYSGFTKEAFESTYFDGNDYLSCTDISSFTLGNNDFTIEFWAHTFTGTPGGNSSQFFAGQGNSGLNISSVSFYITRNNNNKLAGVVASGSTSYSAVTTSNCPINSWFHFAFVRNGNIGTVYFNGVAEGTVDLTDVTVNNSSNKLLVGGIGDVPGNWWPGHISNFRMVIGTAVYTGNFSVPIAFLAASGADSVTSYVNTTNINTTFPSSNTKLLTCGPTWSGNPTITLNGDVNKIDRVRLTPFIKPNYASVYFDGMYQTITVSNSDSFTLGSSGDFTIECWFCLISPINPIGSQAPLVTSWASNSNFSNRWNLNVGSNILTWYDSAGNFAIRDSETIPLNTWTHVAVVRVGSTITLYKNGVSLGTQTTNQAYTTQGGLTFGSMGSSTITGYISNFRIVKGTAVYTSNFTPSMVPLTAIANTSLLTFQSTTIVDNSTNNFAITVNGNQKVSSFHPFRTNIIESYSSDLDFGTNEWHISTWLNVGDLLLGNELLINGDFSSNDLSNWSGPGTLSVENGKLKQVISGVAYPGISQANIPVTIGRVYKISATESFGDLLIGNDSTTGGELFRVVQGSSFSYTWVATVSLLTITKLKNSPSVTGTAYYDNFSVKEILPGTICSRSYSSGPSINLEMKGNGHLSATVYDGTTTRNSTAATAYNTAVWLKFETIYQAGRLGIRINGEDVASTTGTPLLTLNNSDASLIIGNNYNLDSPFPGLITLAKISATVPTPDQSRYMYLQERKMFDINTKVCLPESTAVTDIAYDDYIDKFISVSSTKKVYWDNLIASNITTGSYKRVGAGAGIDITSNTSNGNLDITFSADKLKDSFNRRNESITFLDNEILTIDYVGGFTANITNGSAALASVANQTIPFLCTIYGALVEGAGIPANTTLIASNHLSAAATATTTGLQINFRDFILPIGYDVESVLVAGVLKQEGSTKDYTILFDGFRSTVRFAVAPGNTAWVQIRAVKTSE